MAAGNDVHYVEKSEAVVEDVLSCIGLGRELKESQRPKLGPSEFYMKSFLEMQNSFQKQGGFQTEYQNALENAAQIAEDCSIHFRLKDKTGRPVYHLPGGGRKESSDLRRLSRQGLKDRLHEMALRGEAVSDEKSYWSRLESELKIIHQMGFDGYFYIVQDFIRWAREKDIPVGPGRGSGASSLVSYSLKITDLDPMPLGLIFERFLNPERINMPDFDIDFCQENRGRVIDYITEKIRKRLLRPCDYFRAAERARGASGCGAGFRAFFWRDRSSGQDDS